MLILVGGWCSCSRLARIGILDEQWKTCCPCCLANVPEILSHLLCECTRWDSKRLVVFGSMSKLFVKLPATLGCFRSLLDGRFVATNLLEEDSSTLLEMQKKKASDEAIHRWWATGEFSYQACSNSMLVAQELDNGSSHRWYRTGLPGFILVGRFSEGVMGVRMSITENLRRLSSYFSNVTTTSRRPEGYGKAT